MQNYCNQSTGGEGLNFHVEGLKIEVGANNWSGGAQPPPCPLTLTTGQCLQRWWLRWILCIFDASCDRYNWLTDWTDRVHKFEEEEMMKKLAAEQAAEQAAQMNAEKLDDAALQLFDKPGLCSQYPVGADSHFRVHTVLEKSLKWWNDDEIANLPCAEKLELVLSTAPKAESAWIPFFEIQGPWKCLKTW